MSAAEQRKLLEALMGKEALGGEPYKLKYNSPKVCKSYLCGLCPHDLFTNTKMDSGPCPLYHSEKLIADYKRAKSLGETRGYEDDLYRALNDAVTECDRKIHAAQRRLEKAPDDLKTSHLTIEITDLSKEIDVLTKLVEKLGEAGMMGKSLKYLDIIDELNEMKNAKHAELKAIIGFESNSQQQKLRVCDTCSAYLSMFDSDKRLADHFAGKMHYGFVKIREKLAELKKKKYPSSRNSDVNGRSGRSEYARDSRDYSDYKYKVKAESSRSRYDKYR